MVHETAPARSALPLGWKGGALAFGDAAQAADVKCPRIVMTNVMKKRRRRPVNRYRRIWNSLEELRFSGQDTA
ncbi:hypothetical protein ACERNI_12460 [Camelimonas sp. ID_303_24]